MSRVMSVLSKNKDQKIEYKRLVNEKFDKKIAKADAKTQNLKIKKANFNAEINKHIAEIKD